MKCNFRLSMLTVLVGMSLLANPVFAKKGGNMPPACKGEVLSGCVGECGTEFSASHIVTKMDARQSPGRHRAKFCLALNPELTSLCPDSGAFFELSKKGAVFSSGDLTELDTGIIAAAVGEQIDVSVRLIPKRNDIVCVRLGDADFTLGYAK